MKIDASKLREYLDSMHEEANARDLRTANIAKIVITARKDGLDGKTVRKIFVRERMDAEKRQRDDDLLGAYEEALGPKGRALRAIAAGVPVVDAARANGLHRATVARARDVAKRGSNATPPHDSETGEITESTAPEANNDGLSDHDSVSADTTTETPVLSGPAGGGTGTECGPLPAPAAADPIDAMMAAKAKLDEMKRARGLA